MENNDKVFINSICNWEVGYHSDILEEDISIPAFARNFETTVGDLLEQIEKKNTAFTGIDGSGSHASLQIIDDEVRAFAFGSENIPVYFNEDKFKELIALEDKATFKEMLDNLVVTDAEASMMTRLMKDIYDKRNRDNEPVWKSKMLDGHPKFVMMRNI